MLQIQEVRMVQVVGKADIAKRKTCWNCASILEYLPIDIISHSNTDYTGCTDITKIINCPSCGKHVTV